MSPRPSWITPSCPSLGPAGRLSGQSSVSLWLGSGCGQGPWAAKEGWPVALSPCSPSGAGPTILALGSLAGLLLCDIWGCGLQGLRPLLRAGTQRRAAR